MWALDIQQTQTPCNCDATLILHFALADWEETLSSNALKEKRLGTGPLNQEYLTCRMNDNKFKALQVKPNNSLYIKVGELYEWSELLAPQGEAGRSKVPSWL